MPWIADASFDVPSLAPDLPAPGAAPPRPDPTFGETMGAAFRQDNTIGSFLSRKSVGSADPAYVEDGFDPWDKIKGTPLEDHWDRFVDVHNGAAFEALKAQIEMEDEDRRTLSSAGWMGVAASLGASVVDWPSFIPGGTLYRSARVGASLVRSAASVGAAAGVSAGLQEAALQATQETRPASETAIAIGGSVILGSLLGGGASAYLSRADRRLLETRIQREVYDNAPLMADEMEAGADAYARSAAPVGAAAVDGPTLDDLTIAGGAAKAVGVATAKLNPLLRGLHSPSVAVREIAQSLMEVPIYLKKNTAGVATAPAVESLMKQYAEGATADAVDFMRKTFRDYRRGGGKLTYLDFRRRVGRAMRREDMDDEAAVSAVAKKWRTAVFEPLKQRAIEEGQLPKDVTVDTAASYFSRIYNVPKIEAQEGRFKEIVRRWAGDAVTEQAAASNRAVQRRLDSLWRERENLAMGMLRRQSDMAERRAGGEAEIEGARESDIAAAVRTLRAGQRPQEPETLTSWLRKNGGLYDPDGEAAALGIGPKTAPGFLRNQRRTSMNPHGGLDLDTAALLAWEQGFIRSPDRPTVNEFLDLLRDDFNKLRRVVREVDDALAAEADRFTEIEAALGRMGVDVKGPRFGTTEDMRGMAAKINAVLDDADSRRIADLDTRIGEVEANAAQERSAFYEGAERDAYIQDIADSIFNKITGREINEVPNGIVSAKRGPMKDRTFSIRDELIEEFLEDDIDLVGQRYARVMAADVELARKYGSPDLKDAIAKVREDYAGLRRGVEADEKLKPEAKAARLAKLSAREADDVADIQAVRDLLRGSYLPQANQTTYARALRVVQTFNYLRQMGGVVASSLADVARPMMVHGLSRVMGDGVAPLVRNLGAVKMSVREARLAGTVAERILNTRMATMAEITDPYSMRSPFERWMDNAARYFSIANGSVFWNDFMKSFASTITQNRVLDDVGRMDAISDRERAYLAFLGIDRGMADRIARQFAEHGQTVDGVRIAGTEDWTDVQARRVYRAAIVKDVDSTIVTKGVGDVPLFAHTPTGRAVLQFKSFALASHQRVLMRGLQESPASVIGGMAASVAIGMFIYWLKSVESNRLEDLSDNPGRWIGEGLDRSGLFAVMFEVNNTWAKVGGRDIYEGLQAMFPGSGEGQASRYAMRNLTGTLMGPTAGLVEDFGRLLSALKQGQLTEGDVRAMRRIAPAASLPVVRSLLEYGVMPNALEAVQGQ